MPKILAIKEYNNTKNLVYHLDTTLSFEGKILPDLAIKIYESQEYLLIMVRNRSGIYLNKTRLTEDEKLYIQNQLQENLSIVFTKI